ncbi:hypothetical protein FA95DRAFT_1659376 [Auriscalpium vulgare]|uniref:Uncharacterized protein n=1 Tax=Auriscalpium vulgare TaxID=40419 RepID=A0ACB8R4H6_9AGAM|nr:hypothetical protein FA95DRAFT_1659376 [Auriscalpium vulgare]
MFKDQDEPDVPRWELKVVPEGPGADKSRRTYICADGPREVLAAHMSVRRPRKSKDTKPLRSQKKGKGSKGRTVEDTQSPDACGARPMRTSLEDPLVDAQAKGRRTFVFPGQRELGNSADTQGSRRGSKDKYGVVEQQGQYPFPSYQLALTDPNPLHPFMTHPYIPSEAPSYDLAIEHRVQPRNREHVHSASHPFDLSHRAAGRTPGEHVHRVLAEQAYLSRTNQIQSVILSSAFAHEIGVGVDEEGAPYRDLVLLHAAAALGGPGRSQPVRLHEAHAYVRLFLDVGHDAPTDWTIPYLNPGPDSTAPPPAPRVAPYSIDSSSRDSLSTLSSSGDEGARYSAENHSLDNSINAQTTGSSIDTHMHHVRRSQPIPVTTPVRPELLQRLAHRTGSPSNVSSARRHSAGSFTIPVVDYTAVLRQHLDGSDTSSCSDNGSSVCTRSSCSLCHSNSTRRAIPTPQEHHDPSPVFPMDLDSEGSESEGDESSEEEDGTTKYTSQWLREFMQRWRERRTGAAANAYSEAEKGKADERVRLAQEMAHEEPPASREDAINIACTSSNTSPVVRELTWAEQVRALIAQLPPGQATLRTAPAERTVDPRTRPAFPIPPIESIAVYAARVPQQGKSFFLEEDIRSVSPAEGGIEDEESQEVCDYQTASPGSETVAGSDDAMSEDEESEEEGASDEEEEPEEAEDIVIVRTDSPDAMTPEEREGSADGRSTMGDSGDSMPALESVSDSESDGGMLVDVSSQRRPRYSMPWRHRVSRQLALARAREALQAYILEVQEDAEEEELRERNTEVISDLRARIETMPLESYGENDVIHMPPDSDAPTTEEATMPGRRRIPRAPGTFRSPLNQDSHALAASTPPINESAEPPNDDSPIIVYSVLVDMPRFEDVLGRTIPGAYGTPYTPRALSPLELLEYPRTQPATPAEEAIPLGLDAIMEEWVHEDAAELRGRSNSVDGREEHATGRHEGPQIVVTGPEEGPERHESLDRLHALAYVAAQAARTVQFEQEVLRRNELGDQNGMITFSSLLFVHEALTRFLVVAASTLDAQEPLGERANALRAPLIEPRPDWLYPQDSTPIAPPLPRPARHKLIPRAGEYNPLFDPHASTLAREEFLYGDAARGTTLAPIPFFGPARTRPNISPLYPDSFIPTFDPATDLAAMTGPFDIPLDDALSTDEEDEETFVFDAQRDTLEHRGILYDGESGCDLNPGLQRFRRFLEKIIADLLIMENSRAETQLQIEQFYSWLQRTDPLPCLDHVPFDMRPNFRRYYTLRSFRRIPGPLRREMFMPDNMARLEPTIRRAYLSLRAVPFLGARDLRRPCLTDPLVVFNINFVVLRFWRCEFAAFFRALEGALPSTVRSDLWNKTMRLVHDIDVQDDCGHDVFRNTNPLFNPSETIFLCTYIKWLQERGDVNLAKALRFILEYVFGDQAEVRHLTFNQHLDVVDDPDDPQVQWAATTLVDEV